MKLFSKYGTHTYCFYCDSRRKKIRHTHVACGGWSLWLHAPKGLERCLLSSVELVESAHDLEDMLAAGLEESLLLVVELELDDLLDTVLAEDNGNTEVAIVDAVLAFELAADGEYALLVLDDSLDHLSCGCAWSVPCGGAHELDELATAILGALNDSVEGILVDEVGYRDAGDGGEAWEWNHGVAVTTEEEALDILNGDAEVLCDEGLVASAVEDTSHADDAVARELGGDVSLVGHDIERVGNDDDDCVGACGYYLLSNGLDDTGVDADKVVAGHARLTREARGDDDDVGVGGLGVVVGGAGGLGVVEGDRGLLVDVESLALSYALFDVDENDLVDDLAVSENVCYGGAYVAGAYNCYFRHCMRF